MWMTASTVSPTDPLVFFSVPCIVQHYVHSRFRSQQTLRVGRNLPIPSRPSANPSAYTPSTALIRSPKTPIPDAKQNNATAHLYPDTPTCITRTYSEGGIKAFYRGLGTNLVRVVPGTCVTFVVYENIAWLLRRAAARRDGFDSAEKD